MYFTEKTEDFIVRYNKEPNKSKREEIYLKKIYPALNKLAENIFNTFKFSYYDTDPLVVQQEVVSVMTSKLDKYRKESGKAFSYFSIVAKNWLIMNNNTTFKKWKLHTELVTEHNDDSDGIVLEANNDTSYEHKEFLGLTIDFWDSNLDKVFDKPKDLKIAASIIELLRMSDRLENFSKKGLYLYIREISGCRTQNITKIVNKMKLYQSKIHRQYMSIGIVDNTQFDKEFLAEEDEFFQY